jgi:hypothetical protein
VRRKVLPGLLTALALVTAGCAGDAPEADVHAADEGAGVLMQVDDPLARASLKEVATASDVIVVGAIGSEQDGITFGSGAGALNYSELIVDVERVVKGDAPNGSVKVLLIRELADGRPVDVEGRPTPTGAQSIWLLKRVDAQFERPDTYVLTSLAGVLPSENGRIADEGASDTPAVQEAVALGTLTRVADYLAKATDY